MRANLERVSDFAEWREVVAGDIEPPRLAEDEQAMVREAADLAASLDWSDDPWHALANALKASTGRKGKALFHPLRLALTAREHGPELKHLLPLFGRERALARLRGETA